MSEPVDMTIEFPGRPPIHTSSDVLTRAAESLERESKKPAPEAPSTRFAKDQLRALVERIIRLEEEKKSFADDIKEVPRRCAVSSGYSEAA